MQIRFIVVLQSVQSFIKLPSKEGLRASIPNLDTQSEFALLKQCSPVLYSHFIASISTISIRSPKENVKEIFKNLTNLFSDKSIPFHVKSHNVFLKSMTHDH